VRVVLADEGNGLVGTVDAARDLARDPSLLVGATEPTWTTSSGLEKLGETT